MAVGLTGTVFSNIMTVVMIAFLPRGILYIASNMITNMNWLFVEGESLRWLNSFYNVPFGFALGAFSEFFAGRPSCDILLTNLWPAGYTIILAVLYYGVAVWIFSKRRSETATQAAVSRKMQGVNRIAFSMIFCLFPLARLSTAIAQGEELSEYLILISVFYLIAIVAYVLYEVVTTKKVSNLAKIFPGLGVLLGLNIVLVAGMIGLYQIELNYCPEAENIKSVSFVSDKYVLDSLYFSDKGEEIQVNDPAVLELVHQALEDNIEHIKTGRYDWEYEESVHVIIRTGSGTKVRNIYLKREDLRQLQEMLKEMPVFKKIYTEFPVAEALEELYVGGDYVQISDPAAMNEIYECFRQEIQKIGFAAWYDYINQNEEKSYFDLHVTLAEGNSVYALCIPISMSMPETRALIAEKANQQREGMREKILQAIENRGENGKSDLDIELEIERKMPLAIKSPEAYQLLHTYLSTVKGTDLLMIHYAESNEESGYRMDGIYFFLIDISELPPQLIKSTTSY